MPMYLTQDLSGGDDTRLGCPHGKPRPAAVPHRTRPGRSGSARHSTGRSAPRSAKGSARHHASARSAKICRNSLRRFCRPCKQVPGSSEAAARAAQALHLLEFAHARTPVPPSGAAAARDPIARRRHRYPTRPRPKARRGRSARPRDGLGAPGQRCPHEAGVRRRVLVSAGNREDQLGRPRPNKTASQAAGRYGLLALVLRSMTAVCLSTQPVVQARRSAAANHRRDGRARPKIRLQHLCSPLVRSSPSFPRSATAEP